MIKEKAYAKINLFLNVVNKRCDGYHDLEMVMASIDLFDLLRFKQNTTGEIIVTSDVKITKDYKNNIVYKIAEFLKEEFNIQKGVIIDIKKSIPIAAGLAGGSADGAATLRGLNRLWNLNLSLDEMAKLGLKFGADIPFCIYNKLCIARGKGEELVFLKKKLKTPLLLINPGVKISTEEVFSHFKEDDLKKREIDGMTSAIYNRNHKLMAQELHNSLETIAFDMEPKIREIKNQMIDLGLDGALMSGSGATVFGISHDKNKLKYVHEVMRDDYFKTITKIR